MSRTLTLITPPGLASVIQRAAAQLEQLTEPTLDVLLADLALGRFDRARTHLRQPAVSPLVAARYVAWTGDLATIAAVWEHIRATALQLIADKDNHDPLRYTTCTELERTATDIGDVRLAAELHRCARAHLQRAAMSATYGGDDSAAAGTILRAVHYTLGLEPDAPRHRLALRPRLSRELPQLHVRDIAFAGGSVSLVCERAHDAATFRIAQDAGATPFTVLLEPLIDAAVYATYVDNEPATLTVRSTTDGTVVPVQLVLEAERTLRVDLER